MSNRHRTARAGHDARGKLGVPRHRTQSRCSADTQERTIERRTRRQGREEISEAEAEMAFEMRAAFGPGVEVINILTGRKHRT